MNRLAPANNLRLSHPTLHIETSSQFVQWLYEHHLSLAFTTYQAGKLFFVGVNPSKQLSIFERTFEQCMGLCAHENSLYMSTRYQLWRFENILSQAEIHEGYDALYLPQASYVTGDLDIHDVVCRSKGSNKSGEKSVVFVNTLFNCLATPSETHSFVPVWKPPFVSELAAGDRCHLNGLTLRNGKPHYVTAVSHSDTLNGWRTQRQNGGCVIDITNNEIVTQGLSMPHSPRWYQGKLWVLNSGTGEFGYIDFGSSRFEPIVFCPGYLRGCAFVGDFAVVGLSLPRHNKTFSGLLLNDRLSEHNIAAQCGLQVIDLRRGEVAHSLQLHGVVQELYDVCVLPKLRRPMAIGFRNDEVHRIITIGDIE